MNEHQLAIAETTGGRSELADSTGIMDYGSLIYNFATCKMLVKQ